NNPLAHGGVEQGISRIGAHAPGVRTSIAVAHALVVARWNQRHTGFAVGHDEERDLFPLQTLLDDDLRACIADQLARKHLAGDAGRLFFTLGDDDAFAGRKSIGFDYNWSSKKGKRLLHFGRIAAEG